MLKFQEPKDPNETKDYSFGWAEQLSDGEIISSQVVSFVDAAGTTSPSDSHDDTTSRVWLSGGTHSGSVVFTIRVVTSGGKTLEQAFSVNIVDSVIGESLSELDRLKAHRTKLLEAKDAAIDGSTIEVWNGRYGNKMKKQAMTYDQICTALDRNKTEIAAEERVASGKPSRGGVAVAWAH